LHNLFPVSSSANGIRGNIDFGYVDHKTYAPCAESKKGFSKDGGSQKYFEPPDVHKGNVARALFYFSIRYLISINDEEENTLRLWNKLDPVDDTEKEHNERIYEFQKDRNPFVDFPDLVDSISNF